MSVPTFVLAVRLRFVSAVLAAAGMILVLLMVGALFPAVGGSIGKLDLPKGVAELLGGADYSSLTGWFRSEIGAVYGPLVIGATAITAAAGSTAGEEEEGILGLVLAHPLERSQLVLAKAAAVAVGVLIVAAGTWIGLVAGVAVAGGGIALADLTALSVHLAFFGFMVGALALALAAGTGRKTVAISVASAYAILGFLVNGFAPLVGGIEWLKYLSPFYYYESNDPIANGIDGADLAVLLAAALVLTAVAAILIRRRDLRG
ncbi:MAG: ABC transporter permease subunit [Solirubrobacterales bacterium]|nr:ABC transporter permease subunit [Solirubrobacterales bacterium]